MGERLKPTGLYIDQNSLRLLKVVAALREQSLSGVVRVAIINYLAGEMGGHKLTKALLRQKAEVVSTLSAEVDSSLGEGIAEHLSSRADKVVNPELLVDAQDALFVGKTLSALIPSCAPAIQKRLQSGCKFRFLLVNPEATNLKKLSESGIVQADAKRTILSTLAQLEGLEMWMEQTKCNGTIEVGLYSGFLGYNATRVETNDSLTKILVELPPLRHQGAYERPQFLLRHIDEPWFSLFNDSLTRLWDDSDRENWRSFVDPGQLYYQIDPKLT